MRLLAGYSHRWGEAERIERLLRLARRTAPRPVDERPRPRRARQLREQDVDRVVELYGEIGTVAGVAVRLGVHEQTVRRHLHGRGIATAFRVMNDREEAEAVRLYESGRSVRVIAEHLGFDSGTVRRALERGGVTMRAKTQRGLVL